jgi:hypothetical protein
MTDAVINRDLVLDAGAFQTDAELLDLRWRRRSMLGTTVLVNAAT